MKLTIIQVGKSPEALRAEFSEYPEHFQNMFDSTGENFSYEAVRILEGASFPDPEALEGIVITGSAAGVYEDHEWIAPLREFIRKAYDIRKPMLGICFGHQIMADALGGDVRKSEKGWGIGRHVYQFEKRPDAFKDLPEEVAIAASHQDQVIVAPEEAEVYMASAFTPNAGLIYRNGAAISMQPHPEFDLPFARGLVELRRNNPLSNADTDKAVETLDAPTHSLDVAKALARFLKQAARA